MTKLWHKKPCPTCGKGELTYQKKLISIPYRGHIYKSKWSGSYCNKCDDGVIAYDKTEEEKWLRFRDSVDRKEAAELNRIRRKLKLTQTQAAELAGGGKNAFSRYEKGHAKPVAAVINLFKLLDRHPELLEELQPR